jgi:hypothetical protein
VYPREQAPIAPQAPQSPLLPLFRGCFVADGLRGGLQRLKLVAHHAIGVLDRGDELVAYILPLDKPFGTRITRVGSQMEPRMFDRLHQSRRRRIERLDLKEQPSANAWPQEQHQREAQ